MTTEEVTSAIGLHCIDDLRLLFHIIDMFSEVRFFGTWAEKCLNMATIKYQSFS